MEVFMRASFVCSECGQVMWNKDLVFGSIEAPVCYCINRLCSGFRVKYIVPKVELVKDIAKEDVGR